MSEVLEGGSGRRSIPPWKWAIAAGFLLVALAVILFGRGSDRLADPAPPSPAPTNGSPVPTSSTPDTSPASPWPSARGACNSTVYLPQGTAGRPPDGIDGTVLVGGTGIRELAVGSAAQTSIPGIPDRTGLLVTGLVAGPDADYAAITSCAAASHFYRIVGDRAQLLPVPGNQFLLGGAHHAWGARYPLPIALPAGSTGVPVQPGPVLTPLDGGPTVELGPNQRFFADTEAGLVVVTSDTTSDTTSDAPAQIELADVATGKRLRWLVAGTPMAAAGQTLLVQSAGCQDTSSPERCSIARVDLSTGRTTESYPMVANRQPDVAAVLSSNQKVAAFQLRRAAPDPRFEQRRLVPPSDIAILHLDTGRLDIVPDLEFSPAASVGLALDATGTAVLASVSFGDRLELLAWKPGMARPGLIAQVAGAFDNTTPPVLLTTG
jgi:hypothetical protein